MLENVIDFHMDPVSKHTIVVFRQDVDSEMAYHMAFLNEEGRLYERYRLDRQPIAIFPQYP